MLATLQGDTAEALTDIEESIRLALPPGRTGNSPSPAVTCYLNLALMFAGRPAEAFAAGETARQRLAACGHRTGLVGLEIQLAYLHQLAGHIDQAVECCSRGLALLESGIPERRAASGG